MILDSFVDALKRGVNVHLIYHTYHVFGLYDNNYVTHIYDKYD